MNVALFYYVYHPKAPNDDRLSAAIVIRRKDRKAIGVEGEARPSGLASDERNWESSKSALLGPKPWKPLRAFVRPTRTDISDTRCDGRITLVGTRGDGLGVTMRVYSPDVTIVQRLAYDEKALDFDRTWGWGPGFALPDSNVVAFAIGVPPEDAPGYESPESGTLVTFSVP